MSEDRRRQIVELVEREGDVRVGDLSRRFEVSEVTIRKDLAELEERGVLHRTHGGASLAYKSRFNLSFMEKERLNSESKMAIAEAALAFVDEGDAVILDGGSTILALARRMKERFRQLVVITCSMPIALELSQTNWDVVLVGGQVRQHSLIMLGPVALRTLRDYQADKCFLGATGVTLERGYSTPNPQDAELKRGILHAATSSFVLTDSSKLGHPALVTYAQLDEVDMLITDSSAPASFVEAMTKRKLGFKLAEVEVNMAP